MSFESVYRSRQGVGEITKISDFIGSLVIKNQYEANKAETSESLYEYIKYHGAYTKTDNFTDYALEDRRLYKDFAYGYLKTINKSYPFDKAILTTITEFRIDTLNKRLEIKDPLITDYLTALRLARIYMYDEKNLYYRQFLGKPSPLNEPIWVINKDAGIDGFTKVEDLSSPPIPTYIYYSKDPNSVENNFIPIGQLTSWTKIDEETGNEVPIADEFYFLNYIKIEEISDKDTTPLTYNFYILQNHIAEIIKDHPDEYYLRFIGLGFTPFYLRSLENYSIIKYDNTVLSNTELFYFFKAYDKAKKQVVLDYINGFDSKQPLYNLLMIQNLLYYTVINYSNSYIERYSVGIYTRENCDDILSSYGYDSLINVSDLSIKQRIVRNLNELISNKGNNYILEIILNKILQDPNVELKRYYLEKKYRVKDTDASIDIDTTKGLENSISLVFREVPALSIQDSHSSADKYRDYDQFVDNDDMWGGITPNDSNDVKITKKEYIKKKLISSNFSSILTKYITLTRTIDIQESQRSLRDMIYMMLKYINEYYSDEFFKLKINFDKYSVTPAGLFAALCWTQQMKNSKNLISDSGLEAEDVVQNNRFEDADVICYDECVITSSVVFRKMGLLSVDINNIENNMIIINGKPVKVMDISPEIASWKVIDFIKENPDLFVELLKDIDIDGTTIPTARFTDVKLMNGVVSEKGVLTMEEAPKDGFKHLVDYNEQLDDFLVHFRYYENGEQLGEITSKTTFAELVMDYKNQYPNLIDKITKKLQKSYDFREFQAWQYMLQQSRTNNSIGFIFKGYHRFTDFLDYVESNGLIDYLNTVIPVRNGRYKLSDVILAQNEINTAFKTWVTDSFSTLVYSGSMNDDGTVNTSNDSSFVNDMKLLFDEFLSVFSQLYSVDYDYSFGGGAETGGLYLQLFYNPISTLVKDSYYDKIGIYGGLKSNSEDNFEDKIELKHTYSTEKTDSFYDNVNNNVEIDGDDNVILDDQFKYEASTHMGESFYDKIGVTEKTNIHAADYIEDSMKLRGILTITTSSGEKKVYYEKDN